MPAKHGVFHRFAFLFPDMDAQQYAELKADIERSGVQCPAVMFDGKVAEGRHRWKICEELGQVCPTVDFDGTEAALLDFVISLNLHRRHLNESQRAMVAPASRVLIAMLRGRLAERQASARV